MQNFGRNVFGITGWKNSGKTTLLEALVRDLTGRDLTVSTVKHAHHTFDIDVPGKGSFRHREAGAQEVIVSSPQRWALMHELRGAPVAGLAELLALLAPSDLVLVEGFKRDPHPKIEVLRALGPNGRSADTDDTIRAIAAPDKVLAGRHAWLVLDDIPGIANFICTQCGLPSH